MDGSGNNGPAPEKCLREFWTRLVEPPSTGDADRRRLSRLLNIILLAMAIVGVSLELGYLPQTNINILNVFAYASIAVLLFAYVINRLGHFRLAVFLSIGSTAATIFLSYLTAKDASYSATLLLYL